MTRPYVPLFATVRASTKLAELDDASERLYLRLLTQCDDWGRHARDARLVMADCWPLLGKTVEDTERCLVALEAAGLIETRTDGALTWIQVPDWEEKGGSIGKRDHRHASRWPDSGQSPATTGPRPSVTGPAPSGVGPRPSDDGPALARSGPRARAETEIKNQTETQNQTESQSSAIAGRCAGKRTDREPPTHPHGRLIQAYTDAYEATYGKKCPFTSRQARAAQTVLGLAGGDVEFAIRVVQAAFADPFWVERGLAIGQIATGWDRFVAIANKPAPRPKLTQAQQSVMNVAAQAASGESVEDPFKRLLP